MLFRPVFNSILIGENSSYLAKIWVIIIIEKKKLYWDTIDKHFIKGIIW